MINEINACSSSLDAWSIYLNLNRVFINYGERSWHLMDIKTLNWWMDLSVFAGINWPREERRGREEERFGYAVLLFDFTPDREIMPPIWWNMPATIEPSFERPVYFGGKNRWGWIIRSMLSHVFGYYNEMVKSRSEGQIGVMGSMVQWWWLMWHIWKLEKGWRRRKGGGEIEASMCTTF